MPSPVELYAKEPEMGRDTANSSQLEELRAELAAVASDFARLVEHKAAQTKDFAIRETTESLDTARQLIRSQPIAAIAVAAVAGAALAVILAPKHKPSRRLMDRDWSLDATKSELNSALDRIKSALPDTSRSSLASSFERVMDSVANVDPKASLIPIWEKVAPFLQSLRKSTIGS